MAFQLYEIDPLDTLFFRDGRPFVAGEGAEAQSLFPPTPLTLQGLVRSLLLTERGQISGPRKQNGCGLWDTYRDGCRQGEKPTDKDCPHLGTGCDAQAVVGRLPRKEQGKVRGAPGSLTLRGPWIIIDGKVVLPAPMDVIVKTEDRKKQKRDPTLAIQTGILAPTNKPVTSNMPGTLVPLDSPFGIDRFESVPGWILWERFAEYLVGTAPKLTRGIDWWEPDDVALVMDSQQNRAAQGYLYFARHQRLERNVRLGVELDGTGSLSGHLTAFRASPFGGERRAIEIKQASAPAPWPATCPPGVTGAIQSLGHAKLVFLQPAWFEGGWIPTGWDPSTGAAAGGASWVATRLERAERFGGWDLARGDQKPIRSFVPRGAVYYMKAGNPAAQATVLNYWNGCLTDTPHAEPFDYGALGVGHVFVGTW